MMHLILHKVRGQPAFDIANRCDDMGTESDPGPWWIIPTSGHRAYPVDYWPLELACPMTKAVRMPDNFAEWPDHYQLKSEPTISVDIGELLSGLMPKSTGFRRRA